MEWLSDHLAAVLRWHLVNPGRGDTWDAPEIYPAAVRVWSIFLGLNAGRTNGFGPNPISSAEIEAYARLNRTPIRPFELDIIRDLDRECLEFAQQRDQKSGGTKPVKASARPMSPGLFDAIFK